MVHFTCDLCGKDLSACGAPRYVVKISAYAGYDSNQITEDDLDDDHMEAIADLLRREEAEGVSSSSRVRRPRLQRVPLRPLPGLPLPLPQGPPEPRAFQGPVFSENDAVRPPP